MLRRKVGKCAAIPPRLSTPIRRSGTLPRNDTMTPISSGNAGDSMDRIYLFVSPEEYPEVKASGAPWDDASKSWYIGEGVEPAMFSRWLGEELDDTPFGIVSVEAFVAAARSSCVRCGHYIEVV